MQNLTLNYVFLIFLAYELSAAKGEYTLLKILFKSEWIWRLIPIFAVSQKLKHEEKLCDVIERRKLVEVEEQEVQRKERDLVG